MFSTSTAEAGAQINYYVTSTYTEYGRVVLRGYFYNSGDVGGTVTSIKFTGTASGININCTFDLNSYVAAGGRTNQDFTINDGNIKSNGNVQLQSVTSWY